MLCTIDTILEVLETDHVRSVIQYLKVADNPYWARYHLRRGTGGRDWRETTVFRATRQRTAAAACRL